MNHRYRTWLTLVVTVSAFSGLLALRHRDTMSLQQNLERERRNSRELESARRTNEQIVAAAELRGKFSEQIEVREEATLEHLRMEIAQLKARAAARSRLTSDPAASVQSKSITQEMVPADQWRNAGQGTAPATLETALWAAAAGDVEALSGLLSIDPVVRTKVNAMLLRLPASLRQDYGTPERLIALLAARDVPMGAAQIRDFRVSDVKGTQLLAVLRDAENNYRSANLTLRQEGEAWKIVVPESAVDRYEMMLKGTPENSVQRDERSQERDKRG
jgi:hypothetical protein